MGGLMASAAGALSNCAAARGCGAAVERWVGVSAAGASSMEEWQISQAEQAAEWWSCAVQPSTLPSHGDAAAACSAWSWSEAGVCPLSGIPASMASVDWRVPCMGGVACASPGTGWWLCSCDCSTSMGCRGGNTPAAMAEPARPLRTSTTINMKYKPRRIPP